MTDRLDVFMQALFDEADKLDKKRGIGNLMDTHDFKGVVERAISAVAEMDDKGVDAHNSIIDELGLSDVE